MSILSDRGLFWWNTDPVLENEFASTYSVAGLLCIEESGTATVELDGILGAHERLPFDPGLVDRVKHERRSIHGKLKGSAKIVRLTRLRLVKSVISTNNLSYEHWAGDISIIANTDIGSVEELRFSKFSVSLAGLEDWLSLRDIRIQHTENSFEVVYTAPENLDYTCESRSLKVLYDCSFDRFWSQSDRFEAKQLAELQFKNDSSMDLDEVIIKFNDILDFLKLLAGTSGSLKWPTGWVEQNTYCEIYFTRFDALIVPFDLQECWATFKQVASRLGDIFFAYLDKKELLAPSFNNYLGTRFGQMVYTEHHFASLIWGLEGLHRGRPTHSHTISLKARCDRILQNVVDPNDKKWLSKVFQRNMGPTLEDRLNELFVSLPIGLNLKKARSFAKDCAESRNLLSHFGGRTVKGDHRAFVIALSRKIPALAILYHALLLIEMGVDAEIVKNYIHYGLNSFVNAIVLSEFGLVPHPVLPQPAKSLP